MHINLDTLKEDILKSLAREHFIVFYGYARAMDDVPTVFWDIEHHPDHEEFLQTAKAVGATMIVFHQQEFSSAMVDDAVDRIGGGELAAEDYRLIEGRLEELRRYDGFTCSMELSFDYQGRVYLFELRSEWFEEYSEILDELEFGMPDEDGSDEDDHPIGGYFSRN
jgi:hypothetical protein